MQNGPDMRKYATYPAETPADQGLANYLQIDLKRLAYWLRIKYSWIIMVAIVGSLIGAGYSLLATRSYTVTSEILVDPAGLQVVDDDLYRRSEDRDTQLLNVDSKLQTLLSRNVLMRVVEKLELTRDLEFVPKSWTSLFSFNFSFGLGSEVVTPPEVIALDALDRRVSARRDERSFVIILTVWSDEAEKSVRISKALIDEFRTELSVADSDGAGRATSSLVGRLVELKASVTEAEEAVETFRRQNGLRVSQGELSSSRSMSQVDTQLRTARERLIAAESRYRQLMAGSSDSAVMQSTTLASLRTEFASAKQQAEQYAVVYGTLHPRYRGVQLNVKTLEREIQNETARLTRAAENEYAQAKTVVAELQKEASSVSGDVFSENEAEVKLRELTREAAARSAIYEAFLARARLTAEREQLDTTNIRVISAPIVPRTRGWPPSVPQASMFGLLAGLALGIVGVLAYGIVSDIHHAPAPAVTRTAQEERPRPSRRRHLRDEMTSLLNAEFADDEDYLPMPRRRKTDYV
ncbi:GumC family protein [Shinella sp. G-2]|uniref:GumC family protein n=1 Tax=Shinella sp. G-2 TaxID=3133141 RepID=UPI003D06FFB3